MQGMNNDQFPPLWNHQQEALSRATNRFALFFDPGTGKSRTAIELFKKADSFGFCGSAIIFAPLNVCRNWQNELRQYLGTACEMFLVAGQPRAQKKKIIESFISYSGARHRFLICNIELLRSKEYLSLLSRTKVKFIIADESHQFKTPTSLQSNGLLELVRVLAPQYLYLLTGTPAPQGYMDLWTTFYLLGKTKDSFFVWRKRYFTDKNERRRGYKGYWPEYVITPKGRATLDGWLAECSMTARKSECLDLPPLLRTVVYAEMSPTQARQYETMKEYLFAIDAEGNELNASNVLVRTLRMQQILAGCTEDYSPRLEALWDAIEKAQGEQFIIWTIFKDTYQEIGRLLNDKDISYEFLTGDISGEERHKNIEAFQAGEIRCLIANPKAGGVGVNLTAASYSIHYTRSFSLVDDLQCEARNYRGGSERHESITRIDIVTPDTIDEEITQALRDKKTVQDFIMGLKNGRETRRAA